MDGITDEKLMEHNINLVKSAKKYLLEIDYLKAKIEAQNHLIQRLLKENLTLIQQLEQASASKPTSEIMVAAIRKTVAEGYISHDAGFTLAWHIGVILGGGK